VISFSVHSSQVIKDDKRGSIVRAEICGIKNVPFRRVYVGCVGPSTTGKIPIPRFHCEVERLALRAGILFDRESEQ
jgi:hypothetical protein